MTATKAKAATPAKKPDEAKEPETKAAPKAKAPEFDARGEILKVHRQLETIANHLNIRLPS